MTQTVPDISPLMPMHQDPLLVYCEVPCLSSADYRQWGMKTRLQGTSLILHHTELHVFRPKQNADILHVTLQMHFLMNEKFSTLIQISLKFVPGGSINNISTWVQVMAWHWTGDKPLLEPMLTQFTETDASLGLQDSYHQNSHERGNLT